MKTHLMKFPLLLGLPIALAAFGPAPAQQRFDDLKRRSNGLAALIDAENAKPALCRSYIGKIVTPVAFDTLFLRLGKTGPKGEFETTADYLKRRAATEIPSSGPFVMIVPIDHNYVSYDADSGAMTVEAGAFPVELDWRKASDADYSAEIALAEWITGRTNLTVQKNTRLLGTQLGRSGLGIPMRINLFERHYKWLSLSGDRLFAFATDKNAPVMIFEIAPVPAQRTKALLRVAIVAVPEAPYTSGGTTEGPAATVQRPERSTYRTSVISASARCALVLDAQMRVLASADAGSVKGKGNGK